jgi:hypothetical protein
MNADNVCEGLTSPLPDNNPNKVRSEVLVGTDLKLVWVVVKGESWGQHVQVQAQRLDGTPLMVIASGENGINAETVALALPHLLALAAQIDGSGAES